MKSIGILPGQKLFVRYSKLSAIYGVRYREVLLYIQLTAALKLTYRYKVWVIKIDVSV